MKPQDGIDIGYMHAALRLAERGWGRVQPNPLVGAVVVRDNQVIGEGFHREYGGPHAEVEALHAAGDAARGATLYVTLEPCAHFGKTPPCTQAILQSGVARVVYGAGDPNPLARGGARLLTQAGIEVKPNVEESYVRTQNAAFFKRHEQGGSFVALKLAMSLDARLTTSPTKCERVTGQAADREVHRLRSGFDAVMIGANTARIDDPLLTIRYDFAPVRAPVRIVIDTNATLAPASRLVGSRDQGEVWVITSPVADATALAAAGARILPAPLADGRLDLREVLALLEREGIGTILCEGGAALGAALLQGGLIDRIYAFFAPKFFGSGGTAAFPLENPLAGAGWRLQRIAQHGEDALLMLDRCSQD